MTHLAYEAQYAGDRVARSLVFAVLGAYSGLECLSIAYKKLAGTKSRTRWLACASLSFGFQMIFTMHFLAMDALTLVHPVTGDVISMRFSAALVSVSFTPTTIGAFCGLWFMEHSKWLPYDVIRHVVSGTFLALGVGAMHYTGILSMCGPFDVKPNWFFVGGTVVVAVVVGTVGMYLFPLGKDLNRRVLVSTLVGVAVTFVHYFGMIGFTYYVEESSSCLVENNTTHWESHALSVIVEIMATILNFIFQVIVPGNYQTFVTNVIRSMNMETSTMRNYRRGKSFRVQDVSKSDGPVRSHTLDMNAFQFEKQKQEKAVRPLSTAYSLGELEMATMEEAPTSRRELQVPGRRKHSMVRKCISAGVFGRLDDLQNIDDNLPAATRSARSSGKYLEQSVLEQHVVALQRVPSPPLNNSTGQVPEADLPGMSPSTGSASRGGSP